MPIFETLDVDKLDFASLVDADLVAVSEAYARLSGFVASDTERVAFKCDAATLNAFRDAACRIVGMPRDKAQTFTVVKRTNSEGKTVWKRLKKDESAKASDETREQTTHTYSGKARREGVKTLRDSQGIRILRRSEGEGIIIVGITRDADDEGSEA